VDMADAWLGGLTFELSGLERYGAPERTMRLGA
jgi:hypothetical protein